MNKWFLHLTIGFFWCVCVRVCVRVRLFVCLSVCVSQLMSPLNQEQAVAARDALSKAVYGRTFTWLVNKINDSLAFKVRLQCLTPAALALPTVLHTPTLFLHLSLTPQSWGWTDQCSISCQTATDFQSSLFVH